MTGALKNGSMLTTTGFEHIRVLDELGSGAQGVVYRVEYKNRPCALKWYPRPMNLDEDAFYGNMLKNISHGSPAPTFLWPLALTQRDGRGRFGYVMPLRPEGYREFSRFLLNRERFESFDALITAAIIIAASFRELHLKGFSYQDLNDGNFFVHPLTGDVLICDTDNVAPDDAALGIKGKPRYMAPEIILDGCDPDTYTDRFSLAVILFLLLCRSHPLEGAADSGDELPEESERRLFAEDPVFIFDPHRDTNRPRSDVHHNALRLWPLYPEYIQKLFISAFDRKNMRCPIPERQHRRITEKEWIRALFRLKDSLFICPSCAKETFYQGEGTSCMNCSSAQPAAAVLELAKSSLVLSPGKKLYPYHLGFLSVAAVRTPIGEVVRKEGQPGIWGLRNSGQEIWRKFSPNGREGICPPGQTLAIARGISVQFFPDGERARIV